MSVSCTQHKSRVYIYIYIYIRLVTFWPQKIVLHYIYKKIHRCISTKKKDEHRQKSVTFHLMESNHLHIPQ
jgi:hypothetical protein